ncbi:DNA-binding response regulator [Sphingomonas koreensis]|nr:DNA-binding response regulator [Sphingomonas koreensis]
MIRTIVCDDEPLALDRLNEMLSVCPDVEIVFSTTDSCEALQQSFELRPDLLVLDVEMPGLDGFDVVERIGTSDENGSQPPLFIFVTAHSNFAFQAFENGAIDFLGKPVRLSRLQMAIARSHAALEAREASVRLGELKQTIDELRRNNHADDEQSHLWIHKRGEYVRIELADISLIRAEGEYVRLFVGGASHLYRESIGSFEKKLNPTGFVRIHRSAIVRCSDVAAVRSSTGGTPFVRMTDGVELPVGRKYAKLARTALLHR